MQSTQIEAQIASYWEGLRAGRDVPSRDEVDPRGLDGVLEFMFVLERTAPGRARLRVAGMHLNRLMGMEVRGMDMTSLFIPEVRSEVSRAFDRLFTTPATLRLELEGRGGIVAAFPLLGPNGDIDRAMGCVFVPGIRSFSDIPQRMDAGRVSLTPIPRSQPRQNHDEMRERAGFAEPVTPFRARPVLRVVRNTDGQT